MGPRAVEQEHPIGGVLTPDMLETSKPLTSEIVPCTWLVGISPVFCENHAKAYSQGDAFGDNKP